MKTIWKFQLRPDIQEIAMPRGAQVLDVQEQHGEAQMWALVDESEPLEVRTFAVVGTGHPLPEPVGMYRGTFQLPNLGLVFHLFEAPAELQHPATVPDARAVRAEAS